MRLTVNGESGDYPDGLTLRQLIARFNLTPERVAVERNRRLVRSEAYDAVLQEGDVIELVTFVGGG